MPKTKAQPKKEQPKPTNSSHIIWIIGIVAVVAIIAIVFVNTRPQSSTTDQTATDDETGIAGQAINFQNIRRVGANTQLTFLGTGELINHYRARGIEDIQDKSGNDVCKDLGYTKCVATQRIKWTYYYDSTDGSCSGELQEVDESTYLSRCDVIPGAKPCDSWEQYAEPRHGDNAEYPHAIDGVICQ